MQVRLQERLRRMIEGMPGGASVTLPVEVVEDWLGASAIDVEPDLTVREVAAFFGKSPQTIRTWIREDRLDAYLFNAREYRVSRRVLEEFQVERRREGTNNHRLPVRP